MTNTPLTGLPLLASAQAQKHITHNEALSQMDTLLSMHVLSAALNTPPTSPSEGDTYIIGASPTAQWANKANQIAHFSNGVWQIYAPKVGMRAFDAASDHLLFYTGSTWLNLFAQLSGIHQLKALGIGTNADDTNALSVNTQAALFSAKTVAQGASGDIRLIASKEAVADTASFLFQTNYSGRAEFGLTGSDHFSLKVSADGSSWLNAFTIAPTTGETTFEKNIEIPSLNGGQLAGTRNLFHNGACRIWQRGTSLTGTLSFAATMDGLYPYTNGGSGYALTVSSITVANTAPISSKKACRIEYTSIASGITGAGAYIRFTADHHIVGKTLVCSFQFRSNIANITTALFFYNNTTSTVISDGYSFLSGSVAPVSDENWHKVSFAFPIKSNVSLSPNDSLSLLIFEKPNVTGYIELTDIQVELGKTPTPFEYTNPADDLTRCQRFYEVLGFGSTGVFGTTTAASIAARFRVAKIVSPTITLKSGSSVFEEPGIAMHTISPTLSGSASTPECAFVYVGGFSGVTVQNAVLPRNDFIIADTGF